MVWLIIRQLRSHAQSLLAVLLMGDWIIRLDTSHGSADINCIADIIEDENVLFTFAFIEYMDDFRYSESQLLRVSMTAAITRALDYLFRSLATAVNEKYQIQQYSRLAIIKCFTRLWLKMKALSENHVVKHDLSKAEPNRFILALFRACQMRSDHLVGCVEFDGEIEEDISSAVVESIHAIVKQDKEMARSVLNKAVTELQRWAEMKIPPSFSYQCDNHPLTTYLLGVGYMRRLLDLILFSSQSTELLDNNFWQGVHAQLSELAGMHFSSTPNLHGTVLEHNVELMCQLFMVTKQMYQRIV